MGVDGNIKTTDGCEIDEIEYQWHCTTDDDKNKIYVPMANGTAYAVYYEIKDEDIVEAGFNTDISDTFYTQDMFTATSYD